MMRESIEQNGFAIIPSVISCSEIDDLINSLEKLAVRSKAGARHLMKHLSVNALAYDKRMLTIARSVLGNSAIPFRATLFDKSSTANWLVVWHQDTALPLREITKSAGWGPWSVKDYVFNTHAPTEALNTVLALRIHLDDSTSVNGPLRVIPGTHKHGVLTDSEVGQLAAESQSVECIVSKGGVVAMRPLIIHASSKSSSDIPRRVIHIEYASSLAITNDHQLAIA